MFAENAKIIYDALDKLCTGPWKGREILPSFGAAKSDKRSWLVYRIIEPTIVEDTSSGNFLVQIEVEYASTEDDGIWLADIDQLFFALRQHGILSWVPFDEYDFEKNLTYHSVKIILAPRGSGQT